MTKYVIHYGSNVYHTHDDDKTRLINRAAIFYDKGSAALALKRLKTNKPNESPQPKICPIR